MADGRLLAVVGLMVIATACAYYTRPTREICAPRATATQAVGRMNAIGDQVLKLQAVLCREGRISKADCHQADVARREMKAAQRDAQAAVMTPGYEMDWNHVLKTMDVIGRVLDTVTP